MSYRVQITPRLIVINADGLPVEDAQVLEISFPGDTIDTPTGRVTILVGAGVAKIRVAGETIRGVALC
jgi:hypothetical protein